MTTDHRNRGHDGRRLDLAPALKQAARAVPRAWTEAWGALLFAVGVWAARPVVPGAAAWVWIVAALAAGLVLAGATTRIGAGANADDARAMGLGPAGLQLGLPEARLVGATALCAIFLTMILSVLALVLLAVFGIAQLDPEAIRMRDWAAVGPAWKLAVLAAATAGAIYVWLVLTVRLTLFAPATLGRGHMVSLNSMGVAEGSFSPLLGGLLLTSLPTVAVIGLTATGLIGAVAAGWLAIVVFVSIQTPLTMGFLGAAYRQLEYWSPEGTDR